MATIAVLLLPFASPLPAPLDTLVDVGGYRLHMVVYRGTRPLTIVMESGGGVSLAAWSGVEGRLAERSGATVVAYDRAGFGESGTGRAELTPREQVRQLHEALERLGTPPARIVVGHSYGGLLSLLHAHLYPKRVRGLVLVDPMNARFVQATGGFVQSTVPHIEHPASAKDTAIARMVGTFDDWRAIRPRATPAWGCPSWSSRPGKPVEEAGHRPRVARQPPGDRQRRAAPPACRGGRVGPRRSREAAGGDRGGGAVTDDCDMTGLHDGGRKPADYSSLTIQSPRK